MKATKLIGVTSSPAPKEWENIPEIKESRPNMIKNKFVEISLQLLDVGNKRVKLVQWWGGKYGVWYPSSDIFLISK